MQTFKSALAKILPQFANNDQQDASEGLAFILRTVAEETSITRRIKHYSEIGSSSGTHLDRREDAAKIVPHHFGEHVVQSFAGFFSKVLVCNHCQRKLNKADPFYSIELPIPPVFPLDLARCLDEFHKEENVEDYQCEFCSHFGIKKSLRPDGLPETLILSLKRFGSSGEKVFDEVRFPIDGLSMQPYLSNEAI